MLRPVPLEFISGNSVKSPEQNALVGSSIIHFSAFSSAGERTPVQCSNVSLSLAVRSCHLLDRLKNYAFVVVYFNNEQVGVFFSKLSSQRFWNDNDFGAISHVCFSCGHYFLYCDYHLDYVQNR